jgi:uncharacterized membrane protein YeiH
LVTAIGSGTARDLLLDMNTFWMLDSSYFITTGVALLATLVLKEKNISLVQYLFSLMRSV